MEEQYDPGVFGFEAVQKGSRIFQTTIYVKNPDTHFFFSTMDVEERNKEIDPDFTGWIEEDGEIIFLGWFDIRKKDIPPIHERMGIYFNIKHFQIPIGHNSGIYDKPRLTRMLCLKTTGKNDRKFNNEYKFVNFDKTRCYKIARFLRAHDYKFSPELNEYLYLRCGIKFDLDLMDVEVIMFNDMKGQVYPPPSTDA